MAAVTRLVTFVDVADAGDERDARTISFTARHEAVLADGRRVVLLDDRGWSEAQRVIGGVREQRVAADSPGIWATKTVAELKRTARSVVGPDEPFEGRSQGDMEAGHWRTLTRLLRRQGVEAAPAELRELPHDVELSDRVLARLGDRRDST